jgi:hypothetical protein
MTSASGFRPVARDLALLINNLLENVTNCTKRRRVAVSPGVMSAVIVSRGRCGERHPQAAVDTWRSTPRSGRRSARRAIAVFARRGPRGRPGLMPLRPQHRPTQRRAGAHNEPIGDRVVQREGRRLNGNTVVIAPHRTRQSRLRNTDESSGNDHGRCRHSSVTHGVPPNLFWFGGDHRDNCLQSR